MSRADMIKKDFRYEVMEKLANDWLNCADMQTLEEYYFNAQMEYLEDIDDEKLIEHCQDMDIDISEFLETK
jgi:hypothetical protein